MVHGPDVEAVLGKDVHHRILGLAGYREVVARARRVRGAVHQKQHRLLFTRLRGGTLAVEVELHVAFAGPVLARLDFGLGLRARLVGGESRDEPCARACGDRASRMIRHGVLHCYWPDHSKSPHLAAVSSPRFGCRNTRWISPAETCCKPPSPARPRSRSAGPHSRNPPRSRLRSGSRAFAPRRPPKASPKRPTRASWAT